MNDSANRQDSDSSRTNSDKNGWSGIIIAMIGVLGAVAGAIGIYYGGERAAKVAEISATATAEVSDYVENPNLSATQESIQQQISLFVNATVKAQSSESNGSVATPYLTYTPYPTYTLYPTYTPVPVAIEPQPTQTPIVNSVKSDFTGQSTEGWKVTNGSLTNYGAGGSGSGERNGCLIWVDTRSDVSYFIAPSKYHGDWRKYSKLEMELWSKGGKYFTDSFDIILVSGVAKAQRLMLNRPGESWETFTVPLVDDGDWVFSDGATKLEDVLVNVTDFRIRAEFGADSHDTTGLDNVTLSP